jgi:hypothetical protein
MSLKLLKIDKKGRLSLGLSFANMPVQIEEREGGEWLVKVVELIPAKEMWLMENKKALNLVTSGILQARKHELGDDPRTGHDYGWLEEVDEENV